MNDNKLTPEVTPEFIPMDTKVTSIVVTTPRVVTDAGKIVGREIHVTLTLESRADPLIITTRGWMVLNRSTRNSTWYLRLNGEEWVSGEEWVGGEVLEERRTPTHINMSKWGRSENPPKPRPEFTHKHKPLSVTLEELGMRKVSP